MQLIDARLKLAQVLTARASLEAAHASVVGVEPARVSVELKLDERAQRRLPEHEIDLATLNKLLNFWMGRCEETAEVVAQDRLIPSTQRHQFDLRAKELDGAAERCLHQFLHG